jgi:hypothetical protein
LGVLRGLFWPTNTTSSQHSPFFVEVRINALAEPAFLMTPAQALLPENLAEAAPLDGNALHFREIGHQGVERPGVKGLIELSRRSQGRLKVDPYLL